MFLFGMSTYTHVSSCCPGGPAPTASARGPGAVAAGGPGAAAAPAPAGAPASCEAPAGGAAAACAAGGPGMFFFSCRKLVSPFCSICFGKTRTCGCISDTK